MQTYVALLRGVNVGGKNKIKMADLRAALEAEGLVDVRTYIQSGNVLFASDAESDALEGSIEQAIGLRFGLEVPVLVRSRSEMRRVVSGAPAGFGESPDLHHSDVVFLKHPLTPEQAMEAVELRDGVDNAWPGEGVLYFTRLSERRTQSKLGKVVGKPAYQLMTIRSWTTTTKLVDLLDSSQPPTAVIG